jgi:hypothetical protein
MPVFSRFRNGVLTLTVDGDYTANELRRVGFSAFEADDAPAKLPVLLDLSGAAGLAKKSQAELAATGAFFGAYRDRLSGVAVVASSDVGPLFDEHSGFASEAGVTVKVCTSHADANAWLKGRA